MKKNRLFCFVLATVLVLSLCACEQEQASAQSANFANTVMGGEAFAYRDGFVYFSDEGYMYEYDTVSGSTARLGAISDYEGRYLVATDEYISYKTTDSSAVRYITRDGKQSGILFDRGTGGRQYFLDENTWYFLSLAKDAEGEKTGDQLWCRDAKTGEETLLYEAEIINRYFLDAEYIYVIEATIIGYDAEGYGVADCWLLRSPKEQIAFEKVDTAHVKPIQVFAVGEDLYIAEKRNYQIWHCADGVVTALPANTFMYQVVDGNLFYMQYGENHKASLKQYNMKTGEEIILTEDTFYFAVFEQRYVTYSESVEDASYFRWYIYDLQTGETKEMVKPV